MIDEGRYIQHQYWRAKESLLKRGVVVESPHLDALEPTAKEHLVVLLGRMEAQF
jgi:hypothetical protein